MPFVFVPGIVHDDGVQNLCRKIRLPCRVHLTSYQPFLQRQHVFQGFLPQLGQCLLQEMVDKSGMQAARCYCQEQLRHKKTQVVNVILRRRECNQQEDQGRWPDTCLYSATHVGTAPPYLCCSLDQHDTAPTRKGLRLPHPDC